MRTALLLASTFLCSTAATAQTPTASTALEILAPNQTLLEVQSIGQSYVAPDQASLTGGVVTFATTSREAADSNARAMSEVVAALKKAGVPARDIQTQSVSLDPQFNYDRQGGEPPAITGYQARNSVTVRVRDVEKASDLLTVLFESGANNVSGPYFSLEDDTDAVAEARNDAVVEAKAEAEAYAAAFDMRVVRVLRVSERQRSANYEPIIVTGSRIGGAGAPPPPPPPPMAVTAVEVGEMQQQVTIWVDFALEPR
ncbi:SIMPL domain-containing protein [Qipengyuania qiaonensis]|uniref:SIMPL domain-containing protein n=1 Tax=Qipengyuania qiaonensis TaxID=2867240 RepID=A0ABS7J133_9SPHN|nr:SIMPL domain-containing protein [Qipengyuania qiaonensis]MBX7481045.1 SIMPL domain-containing protein [Qipengyuania qiaonensis]